MHRASGPDRSADGRFALIVPISAEFGDDFRTLREHLGRRFANLWVSAFSRNPAALFSAGLGVRSTIIVGAGGEAGGVRATKTHRWYDAYRPALFETLEYVHLSRATAWGGWPRPTGEGLLDLFDGLLKSPGSVANAIRPSGAASVGFKSTALYWLSVFLDDPPSYNLDGGPTPQTKIGRLRFASQRDARLALGLLATKASFVWWYCTGDDFDVTGEGLKSFPINPLALSPETQQTILRAVDDLIADFPNHVAFTKYAGKWMGNFVHSEMRDITDRIDAALTAELGYSALLPALEHAYHCVYKPTGDRPGTLRHDPFA